MVIIITFLEEFTQKLRASRKKRWAQTRKRFSEIGDVVKNGTDAVPEESPGISTEAEPDPVAENSAAASSGEKTLGERIHERNLKFRQKTAERNERMRAKSEERIEARYAKHDDFKKRMKAIDPGKKRLVELIFMGVTAALAMLFIGFDIWPASFFNDLEFQKGYRRTDLFVFLETCITLFLFASPILMYTFRRMAKNVVLKEPEEFNHNPLEDTENLEQQDSEPKSNPSENKNEVH